MRKYSVSISCGWNSHVGSDVSINEYNPKTQENKTYKVDRDDVDKLLLKAFKKFGHIQKAEKNQKYDRIIFEI